MKKNLYLIPLLGILIFGISCSSDDKFDDGGGGNIPPVILSNLFTTSNSSSTVSAFRFTPEGIIPEGFNISSDDNRGVIYNKSSDELYILSRAQRAINVFSNVNKTENGGTLNLAFSSSSDFDSPTDLAVKGEIYVVADNADLDGNPDTFESRIFIYTREENELNLRNTLTLDFAIQGITFIGNDLYATVDHTGDIAVFKNLVSGYTTTEAVDPDKRITLEGITRIHGISADGGAVTVTDIGDENNKNDGGFHVIAGFVSKFNSVEDGGILEQSGKQIRVSGLFTELGNPVAVAYSHSRNMVFIAENTNGGGKILIFTDIGAGGELFPTTKFDFPGAAALYYSEK